MQILQLTKKFPYPLNDGESIAIYNLTTGLVNCGAKVDLLSLNTSKHFTDLNSIDHELDHYASTQAVYHNNDIKYSGAFANLFTSESYHVQRLRSPEFEEALRLKLEITDYDVILLETIYMSLYIPVIKKYSNASICLRAHNIEYEIWRRCSTEETNLAKAWYLKLCASRLKKFETVYFSNYSMIAAITDKDSNTFRKLGYTGAMTVAPVGLDSNNYQSDVYHHRDEFCFIGSLDWMPNLQGLQWFLKEVWPKVYAKNNKIRFHIAGKNAPVDIDFNQIRGVVYHGEVECATDFIREHGVLIVPLYSGSGIRVKILEAMAMRRPVITTEIGLEGIHATHEENILIANTAEHYIKYMSENKADYQSIGNSAKEFVNNHFDYNKVGSDLYNELSSYLKQQSSLISSDY